MPATACGTTLAAPGPSAAASAAGSSERGHGDDDEEEEEEVRRPMPAVLPELSGGGGLGGCGEGDARGPRGSGGRADDAGGKSAPRPSPSASSNGALKQASPEAAPPPR
mmetsp:Transcript_177478/g.569191  ORF Transcript_177478/g.569191 Transcript_177478/m.569191 type:complete len:109 (-) Transcript_177478:1272-1598(-)